MKIIILLFFSIRVGSVLAELVECGSANTCDQTPTTERPPPLQSANPNDHVHIHYPGRRLDPAALAHSQATCGQVIYETFYRYEYCTPESLAF